MSKASKGIFEESATPGSTEYFTGSQSSAIMQMTMSLAGPVLLYDGGGSLVGAYPTIQAAIDAASNGYTVSASAGTYSESVVVDKDITLEGPNAGIAGTDVRGDEAILDGQIEIIASGATIDGFRLVGHAPGSLGNTAVEVLAGDFALTNSVLDGNGDVAIITSSVSGLDVGHNLIRGYSIGLYVSGPETSGSIHDNRFQGAGGPQTGLGNGVNSETSHVAIANNVFDGLYAGSLNLFPFGPDSVDLEDYVSGNTITNSGPARPVQILPTQATHEILGTDFNEAFDGETAAGSYGVSGAFGFDGRGGDDRAWGGEAGDSLTGGSGDDRLFGNGGGDMLTGGTGDDLIEGGAGDDTIAGGDDMDTAVYGGDRSGYAVTVITDPNGRATGFTAVSDTDSGNGDSGTDSLSGVEKLQFGDVTLDLGQPVQLYDSGGTLVGTFDTIQQAIDAAAAGATISVAAGSYNEVLNVDKDVTIVGSNAGKAGDDLSRGAEAVIKGAYMSADGATLDGLKVGYDGTLVAGNPTGILVTHDGVTLTNLVIDGIDQGSSSGITTTYNGGVSGLAISNNLITDFFWGAYLNPTTGFTATGNTFTSNTAVDIAGDDWASGTQIGGNNFPDSITHIGYSTNQSDFDFDQFLAGAPNSFGGTGRAISVTGRGDGDAGGQHLHGTAHNDSLNDSSAAPSGVDGILNGEGGDDRLTGNAGNDVLIGGAGNDILRGGVGIDTAGYADAIAAGNIAAVADGDPSAGGAQPGWTVTTATQGTDSLTGVEIVNGAEGGKILLVGSGGFATIQQAINAADDGDTILVAAGVYDEDLLIDKGVTIRGAQADVAVGGRNAASGAGETTIIGQARVTATENVTVNGVRFLNDATTSGSGRAIHFETGGGAEGHLVTDSIFWSTVSGGGADDRAVSTQVITDGLITIADNLISGTSQGQFGTASWGRGLWFDGGGVDLVFTGNVVEWTRTGLNLDMSGDSTANVSSNVLRGLGTGMALGIDSVGLTVAGNTVERVGTEFSFRNITTGATFDAGAAIGTLTPVGDSNDLVVVLGGSGNDALTGTSGADVIDGNNSPTAPNADDGDVLSGGGGNDQLFGRGGDDVLDGGTGDDSMSGGTGNDVYVVDSTGDTVAETSGTDEIRTTLASYTLAADLENLTGLGSVDQSLTGNGGDNIITGGAGNDAIDGGGGIDTARYAGPATIVENGSGGWTVTDAGGTDTLANVERVDDSAAGRTLLVGNGGYGTIQAAIDAASDGDFILIASGTYAETLNVNKDVTLLGANRGVAGTAARGPESVIDGQITISAAGATLDGVRIVGAAPGSLYNTAVEVKASGFTLVNSVLNGTSDIAIFVGLVSGLEVGRNLISGSSIGMYVAGGNTSGSIHDNRFQGNGGPATGLGNGVNSESSHVIIANNVFDGIYAGSLNLFPFGPDSVDLNSYVVGNTITNSGVARPVQILPTSLTHDIAGTDFNDAFDGETAALNGVAGAFSFNGRGGDDRAWGGEEGDTLGGGAGNDQLFGNGGNDNLSGGDNNDIVSGGTGADTVSGGNGNDVLNGGDDDDSLSGGAGVDSLSGDLGNDTLHGGAGNDTLHGGAGTDRAVYDGHRGDYSISMATGAGGRIVGFTAVSDNEPANGNEGADSLISMEVLQFSNRTLDSTLPVQLFDQNNQLIGTFGTIQAAIDGAQDNYTIRVAAGVYDEDLAIGVGVRILGARVGAVTGRDASGGVGETTIVGHAKVTAEDNVTLTGLRFLNDATTTGGGPSNPTLQFLTGGGHLVSNSIFWSAVAGGANGVDDRAISAPAIADGQLTFTGNLISGASQGLFGTASWGRGIWMDGGGVALAASGNIVEWTRSGLVLDGAGGSVYFVSNNILRNLGTAFSVATTENGLVESGNTFRNVGDEYNFRNLSEDVTFDAGLSGNNVQTVGTPNDVVTILGGSGNDVLTGTSGDDFIDANNRQGHLTLADTDVLNGAAGNDILLGRFGTDTLNGGTGEDNLDGGAGDDVLNGEADNDTLSGGAGDDRLTGGEGDDSIDGGTGIDTAFVGTGATYTASGTGWQVSSASSGTDTLTNVEIVDSGPGPNVLLVGSGGFATIQAAVDAARDGDTILVATGTYVEQVTVSNVDNLTIMAADGASVTIKAPADLVETARSSSDREIHAVLTAKDSLNLTLQNIDIDGDGRGNTVDEGNGGGTANFYGVYYRNSSGSLLDVDIRGVRDPYPGGTAAGGQPLVDGVQRGIGLVVDNDVRLGFTMIGGSISDFQKNAAVFNRADLNVAGIVITGGGAQTIIAQNGIQVANSTGSISANTISGLGYAGPADAYSGAILSSGNTNLSIAGNVITGSNIDNPAAKAVGIWVYQTGAPNSGGMIVGNSISHVDYGISVDGDIAPNAIQIENNSIANLDSTDTDPVGVYFAPSPALVTAHDVDGSEADDSLSGGSGNDVLSGLDANDVLTGNGGDDILDGGGGCADVAVYQGPRAGYSVTAITDGAGLVTGFTAVDDTDAGNGDQGTDTLTGVEQLRFGDAVLDLADPVQLFDSNGHLVGTFDTIQSAVDAAVSGYTIRVAAGTYAELVTVDKDVTIAGPNAGAPGAGERVGEAVVDGFYMHAAGATLDGLTVLGGGMLAGNPAGIYVDANGVTLTNLVLEGDGTAGTGVLTTYDVTDLELSDSLVTLWDSGTYFNPGTQFTATGNSFVDNGNAIVGDDWGDGTLIDDNGFTGSVGAHIGYGSFDSVDDVGAYFGPGNSFDSTGGGRIGIFAHGDGDAGGQEITGTQFDDYMAGVESDGSGNGAVFHGEGGNDYIHASDGDDRLDGGAGDDILLGGFGTDTAVFADPIALADLTLVPDADPEAGGNQAGWIVTTATEGTDRLVGIEIVEGADSNILLVGNGGFATIQAAIDAAGDGDTILVAPGIYFENLDVHVGVTILGAKAGVAVAGRDAAGGSGETTIVGHAVVSASAGVTVDGLRFFNDQGSTAPTLQFLTGGGAAGHLVTDSIFWSAVAGGANGVDDRAISTVVIADGTITIADNLISGSSQGQFGSASWGRGIWFDGGGVDLVVTGNVIEWSRTGLNLDMSGNSTVNLSGNTLRGLGTGIAVGVDADGLTVSDNDIERVGTEFSFRNLTTGVTFNAGAAIGIMTTVGDANDLIVVLGGSGDDGLTGTEGADVIDGNNSPVNPAAADADVLNGLGGNDELFGRGGDDMLDGGTGDDAMTGGTGNDVYVVDTAGDSVVEAAGEGTDEVRTALATYALAAAVENLTGLGNVDQTLIGNSSDNLIDGGLGADSMTGGAGNDIYVVDNAGDTVTELAGEGTDEIRTGLATYSLAALANVENLTGTSSAGQTLTGNGSANVIAGAGGNDTIDGGAGADQMRGGGGDDLYFVDNSGDLVVEIAGEGTDEVRTGSASHVLAAHVENLTATNDINHDFRGNAGNNVIKGGSGNDLLRLQDGGDDTVLAGAGNDNIFMIGSLNAADVVNGGTGTDTLILQGNYAGGLTLTANVTQIELISILAGSNTNFGEPGTNRHDYVLTTHDANFAAGLQARVNASALLAGEDFTFDGSAETDATFVVYGGKGKDTLIGGHGNDIFIYAEERFAPGDTVNGGPGGYDGIFFRGNYTIDFNAPGYFGLMTGIENMTLTSITDERYARGGGTEFDYNITLADNMLNAGIELTVSGALLQAYETMIVDGSLEMDGHLRFFAGKGNDTLKGGAQSDLILGSLGADTISGGGGADTFRYDTIGDSNLGSLDHILDFTAGTDKIDLTRVDANTLVAGNQAFTWIGSNAFSGSAGQLRAVQQGGEWMIEGDTNGDGVADLVIAVTLQGATPLSAGDFFP